MREEHTRITNVNPTGPTSDTTFHAYLIVVHSRVPAMLGRMIKVDRNVFTVGRSPEAHFTIEDDGISRKHISLVRGADDSYQVMDLGSTNGTFVNNNRVDGSSPVQNGDKIQLGSKLVLKFSLQDQLDEEYQRSIYDSATLDSLTKAFNKRYFLETLKKEMTYSLRHKKPLSLLMLDIDFFKKVNDTYGHLAGDAVLTQVASVLRSTLRTEDLLARYGGEEFSVVLRESPAEAALRCAERCRVAIEAHSFEFNGTRIPVTMSLGVATFLDSPFDEPASFIEAADGALYEAKRAGRNRVMVKG